MLDNPKGRGSYGDENDQDNHNGNHHQRVHQEGEPPYRGVLGGRLGFTHFLVIGLGVLLPRHGKLHPLVCSAGRCVGVGGDERLHQRRHQHSLVCEGEGEGALELVEFSGGYLLHQYHMVEPLYKGHIWDIQKLAFAERLVALGGY